MIKEFAESEFSDDRDFFADRQEHQNEAALEEKACDEDSPHFAYYEALGDAQTVKKANAGDGQALEYLLNKYKNFVRAKARYYFLAGADKEDIVQEGMIGLYKAVRDFQPEKQVSFRAFAELCITRQVITAVKSATRQKHKPLNGYVSLNRPVFDEESDRTMMDMIKSAKVLNPEEIIISKEDIDAIEHSLDSNLSVLEKNVLNLYLNGKSYQEIAKLLDRQVKSIDNALQRIKAKIEKHLSARNQK